jgi:prolipoprotein diacylglyceryltransferase
MLINNWPRGKTDLTLTVEHADGRKETLPPFEPRTIGLHPTQLYETVSTFLLFLLLLALEGVRPKTGMLMAVLMLCYSVHRFLNESLRNDTATYPQKDWTIYDFVVHRMGIPAMTLSQWISIVLFLGGLALLAFVLTRKPKAEEQKPEEPKPEEPKAEPQPA